MTSLKLVKRSTCYRLTWQGWALVLLLFVFATIFASKRLPYFLSANQPIGGNVLLLDGQVPDYAVEKAIEIFNQGHYQLVVTTGGRFPSGFYISDIKTMAELTRATFLKLGFPPDKIVALPSGEIHRDRTYHSALMSKEWIASNTPVVHKVDVVAVGCHARRSRYLFQKAMGSQFEVGIICVPDQSFSASSWWKSSIGARTVISETIGYFYVKLFQ